MTLAVSFAIDQVCKCLSYGLFKIQIYFLEMFTPVIINVKYHLVDQPPYNPNFFYFKLSEGQILYIYILML